MSNHDDMIGHAIERALGFDQKPTWVPREGETVVVQTMYLPRGEYLRKVVKVTAREVQLDDHNRYKRPSLERIGAPRNMGHKLVRYVDPSPTIDEIVTKMSQEKK
jgi:hypothetical protein